MTKEHVERSILDAAAGVSGIDEFIDTVRGFSTPTMRRLFHNICSAGGVYLEVGLYCGATFVSSFNKDLISIGVEDYSQDFSISSVKQELEENINKYYPLAKEVKIYEDNCFAIEKDKLPDNINIFFYDGNHSEENQAKALPHFLDKMADRFLYIVDDTNWGEVKIGTLKGIAALQDKIEIENSWELVGGRLQDDPMWHNGMCLFLIKKKA